VGFARHLCAAPPWRRTNSAVRRRDGCRGRARSRLGGAGRMSGWVALHSCSVREMNLGAGRWERSGFALLRSLLHAFCGMRTITRWEPRWPAAARQLGKGSESLSARSYSRAGTGWDAAACDGSRWDNGREGGRASGRCVEEEGARVLAPPARSLAVVEFEEPRARAAQHIHLQGAPLLLVLYDYADTHVNVW
jgi:hypothetical protein